MKKEIGGIITVLIAIFVVIAVIIVGPWVGGQNPFYNPQESLPHLAAPSVVPGEQVNVTVVDNLSMSVTGFFHTMSPHNSPTTFDFTIDMIVNNTGPTAIDDFHIVKVTVFDQNYTPVYTFGVVPYANLTISGNYTTVHEIRNDRDMVTIPSDFMWSSYIFARVLITFDGATEVILTTPLTMFLHAIE